ncbi:hypothetical protein F9802_15810 [Bacillus aerolatus]|uniref:Uncharacterized protein n=1 Tax=Bacillus aerolatus TaxID=2653354 RepID=A0A6I1FGV9_9BACI|nr:hypothetical protein [Bacillus aerolatus]KAB7705024.1 hypothetical protein F9802_15810 [Bacillus aerolatus]
MKSFIHYQLLSLFHSLKWMPPAMLYIAWIFTQYYYKNLPMADSYSISAVVLYPIIVWNAMSVFNLEKGSEKLMLLSYMPKRQHFLYGKIIVVFLAGAALAAISFFMPLLLGIFNEPLTIQHIVHFMYGHVVFILFGIFTGGLFSATNMGGKKYSWSGSAFFVCAAIVSTKIMDVLPVALKWIVWSLPPVGTVTNIMKEGITAHPGKNIWIAVYLIIGFMVLIKLFLTREKVN